ncbi:protein NDR1-like [Syzygium oleosum]|uniref:protein NDR1-like n=1 Tax=Syzygium oleosum TaxID=219896 RepID=UPI0024B8E200|nr:protein NDR1-like [Syzygium oleosum]
MTLSFSWPSSPPASSSGDHVELRWVLPLLLCRAFIFSLVLTALFTWLPESPSKPSCSIQQFYLPAFNRSSDTPTSTPIFLDVNLSNGNKERGIHYDPVNLTLYYYSDTNQTEWLKTIPGFYQVYKKKATKNASVETFGMTCTDVVAKNESLVFRVDLATAVRFQIMVWKTERYKLMVGANVTLNAEGAKTTKKDIKLKSRVCTNLRGCFWQVGIYVVALWAELYSVSYGEG